MEQENGRVFAKAQRRPTEEDARAHFAWEEVSSICWHDNCHVVHFPSHTKTPEIQTRSNLKAHGPYNIRR